MFMLQPQPLEGKREKKQDIGKQEAKARPLAPGATSACLPACLLWALACFPRTFRLSYDPVVFSIPVGGALQVEEAGKALSQQASPGHRCSCFCLSGGLLGPPMLPHLAANPMSRAALPGCCWGHLSTLQFECFWSK